MSEWSFTLRLNQALTPEQADAFDHCDAFADGSVSYVLGASDPEQYAIHHDAAKLKELMCDVEAPTLLDAVAQVARDIQLIPGLRAVGVHHDDLVTLDEAAQRCNRSVESLTQLSQKHHDQAGGFPESKFETAGNKFYSWNSIAKFLRSLGDEIQPFSHELVVADHALRLVEDLRGVDIAPGVLRSLGLPAT